MSRNASHFFGFKPQGEIHYHYPSTMDSWDDSSIEGPSDWEPD